MKELIKYIILIACVAVVTACEDKSLDPLQFDKVKKGTLLALRGTQLSNIYNNGLPGAEMFPKAVDGTEAFEFEAEYLAEDPSTLESFDIYAIKRTPAGNSVTTERVLLRTVSASEFQQTDKYLRPSVHVSIPLTEILDAIGQDPNDPDFAETMLDLYEFGINIESDLNLTDGSQVLAEDIVAAGLFQSDQFYPAQKLNYAVTNYCPEDLGGTYSFETTVTAVGDGGDITGCDGGVSGDGELVAISRGKYSISDVSFGQYACAWADYPAIGATLVNTCDALSFGGSDQYDLIYTISNVSVSADGMELSFKWENDYGDAGTTTLTRTDDKLWPLGLH